MWQLNAAINGYVKANTPKEKGSFESEEERDAIFAYAQAATTTSKKIKTSNNVYIWDGKNFSLERTVHFIAEQVTAKPQKSLREMFQKKKEYSGN